MSKFFNARLPRSQILIALFSIALFAAGYGLGSARPARIARAQTNTPPDAEALFNPFWEVWRLLHVEFVEQPLDDTALMQGAITGMLATLDDEHTVFMTPDTFATLNADLSGEFEGIGAEMEQNNAQQYIVTAVLEGSPAQQSGLLSGDELISVDGVNVYTLEQSEVLTRVRGPQGTSVTLTIQRAGVLEYIDIVIVRAVIKLEDVTWHIAGGDVAYIRLAQFGETSHSKLRASLPEIMALHPRGIVLDLRGNPGGLLDAAVDISSEFIASGPIVRERTGDGFERVYDANGNGLATDIPLIVLVDEHSASASELLAAAIQDYERGTVIGETTFGKGTVQSWHALSDGSGARITSARWLSPHERSVHGNGLQPDLVIPVQSMRPYGAAHDLQLNAAIDLLHGQTVWPGWPLPMLDRLSPGTRW